MYFLLFHFRQRYIIALFYFAASLSYQHFKCTRDFFNKTLYFLNLPCQWEMLDNKNNGTSLVKILLSLTTLFDTWFVFKLSQSNMPVTKNLVIHS